MSQWTHVCGCIRVNALRLENGEKEKDAIVKALGRIVHFEDEDYSTTVPCGSEGSLEYEIIENPDMSSIAAFTIPIWGDLRDYSKKQEIKDWFQKACDKLFIRNAVISIEIEGFKEETYLYKRKERD